MTDAPAARTSRWWRVARLLALVAALLGVSVFALSPLPLTEQVVSWQDKVEHVLAFLVLTLLSLGLWRARWLLAGWAAFAGFIELGQSFMPGRTASWGDWLASTGGVLLALLLHRLWCLARKRPAD